MCAERKTEINEDENSLNIKINENRYLRSFSVGVSVSVMRSQSQFVF